MAEVTLENIRKVYPGDVEAVTDFNLAVDDGQFVVLVGPSGCGKSTVLRMIAGLEEITEGEITIGGRTVNDMPPKNRDIAMVFQNYALYPHMTVYKNMAFALKLRRLPRKQIDQRVREAARILGIEELLHRKPRALSGGQRQRVAVGRAIVRKPSAFLFDEPLSNLDAKLRVEMRAEIKRLHRQLQMTTIYVTHDQEEAMTLGDRIVVMKDGVVHQCSSPLDVYNNPVNRFVGSFVGTPPMNFFNGVIATNGAGLVFKNETFSIPLPNAWKKKLESYSDKPVVFGIRPEDIGSVQAEQQQDAPRIKAKVEVTEPMGSETYLYLNSGDTSFICRADAHLQHDIGSQLEPAILIEKAHLFDHETGQTII